MTARGSLGELLSRVWGGQGRDLVGVIKIGCDEIIRYIGDMMIKSAAISFNYELPIRDPDLTSDACGLALPKLAIS